MKILNADEWFEQNGNLTKTNYHINEYAKYLLEKQAEYITERLLLNQGNNRVISVSNEFIKQLKLENEN